jgi:tetratricopeptide (TPR) repeat protein
VFLTNSSTESCREHYLCSTTSLEGRINRERWQLTGGKEYLDKAFDSYFRAYEADKMQYYPGINAGSLALARGDVATAEKIFADVLRTCETLQRRPVVSYWTDFTAGNALLGMGQTEEAGRHYRTAFTREPPRHRSPRNLP